MKNQYITDNCLKREAWTVCRFQEGGFVDKEGVVFLRKVV